MKGLSLAHKKVKCTRFFLLNHSEAFRAIAKDRTELSAFSFAPRIYERHFNIGLEQVIYPQIQAGLKDSKDFKKRCGRAAAVAVLANSHFGSRTLTT